MPLLRAGRAGRAGLLSDFGDVRYVWRHLPLNDVHPNAQLAAEAAEAADRQERSGRCTTCCSTTRTSCGFPTWSVYADELGLDVERFEQDLHRHAGAGRVAEDVDSADLSGVSGTPTFFVNGRRHHGAYDIDALSAAVRGAGARAAISSERGSLGPPPARG